jgi:heme exporter protein B
MRAWLHGCWAVFLKDARLEWRNRFAVNLLFMFVLSSLLLIAFSLGREAVGPRIEVALLWMVILFSAALGLGRSFVAEEEQGTVMLLQLNLNGSQVLAGKMLFNFLLLMAVNLTALVVMRFLLTLSVSDTGLLLATLALGSLGLAAATTMLAAIIARASASGPLLPVLLFPMLAPLLLSVVRASRHALEGGLGWSASGNDIVTLVAFAGVVITAAFMLFEYVWTD